MKKIASLAAFALAAALPMAVAPEAADAQGRGNRGAAESPTSVTLSAEVRCTIEGFYSTRTVSSAEALPPGIRRRLERGKALPPGIAKKVAPPELRADVSIPDGFEIVEVGLDVLLVEVATNIVHDVLMDIVR